MTGPIPLFLGSLSKLTNISLTNNALSGPISESHFGGLKNLKYLDLSSNKFAYEMTSTWIPPFHLDVLILSHCQIEGAFPSFLKNQISITGLDLSNNTITGEIPSWLWNLPKLERLSLSHNQLQGPIPPQLYNSSSLLREVELRDNQLQGNLPNLGGSSSVGFPWELDLSINKITGSIPQIFCTMLHTSNFLSLASNKLGGQIPACICEETEHLEALDLSGNKLCGELPSGFSKCSSLKVLNVADNNLDGKIPMDLGKLNKLQVLHINHNCLSGNVPSTLRNCKTLEILDLSGNRISGKVSEWNADLSKLRILILRSNNLDGEIPIHIRYLQKLQILDLAMNRLTGSIPRYLSNLSALTNEDLGSSVSTVLRYGNYYKEEVYLVEKGQQWAYKYILSSFTSLDLSANKLSGGIPEDMGYLKGLHSLNLSHNHLTGSVPHELGEMTNLEALDISCNLLSGSIPDTFADLDSLGSLNLSNNNLSGMIPNLPHLDTFGASSFSNNPELCGLLAKNNCISYTYYSGVEEGDHQGNRWWESWKAALGMGWAIGFGTVIGALALSRRLCRTYFSFVDNIVNFFYKKTVCNDTMSKSARCIGYTLLDLPI